MARGRWKALEGGGGTERDSEAYGGEGASEGLELTLEGALGTTGIGRFQVLVICLCGLANAADAVEVLAASFLLPTAGPELGMDDVSKAALQASVFAGMLGGALVGGSLADARGRKFAMAVCMAVTAIFGALSAVGDSILMLVGCRALAGLGVGGSAPLAFSYASELTPAHVRGKVMMLVAAQYMVGSLATVGLAATLMPLAGWRGFSAAAAAPAALCCVLVLLFMPESPRYLLVQGDSDGAMRVLRQMAAANRVRGPAPGAALTPLAVDSQYDGGGIRGWARRARCLLAVPALRRSTLSLALAWFAISFGWYGNMLYLPTLFAKQEGGATAAPPPPMVPGGDSPAAEGHLPSAVYVDAALVAAANLPGNLASIWLIDWAGRKRTLICTMGLGGISAVLVGFAPQTAAWSVAAGVIFNGLTVGGWNAIAALTSEVFPTPVRATAGGLVSACGRIGGASSGLCQATAKLFGDVAPLVVGGIVMMTGSLAVSLGVDGDTAGRALADTIAEGGDEGSGEADALLRIGVGGNSSADGRQPASSSRV